MKKREPLEYPDSQQFLDSVVVLEKETVPIEFYGDTKVSNTFTSAVEFDEQTQEYYITIPDEMMKSLDWNIGDTLQWEIIDQETVIISKKK